MIVFTRTFFLFYLELNKENNLKIEKIIIINTKRLLEFLINFKKFSILRID